MNVKIILQIFPLRLFRSFQIFLYLLHLGLMGVSTAYSWIKYSSIQESQEGEGWTLSGFQASTESRIITFGILHRDQEIPNFASLECIAAYRKIPQAIFTLFLICYAKKNFWPVLFIIKSVKLRQSLRNGLSVRTTRKFFYLHFCIFCTLRKSKRVNCILNHFFSGIFDINPITSDLSTYLALRKNYINNNLIV